MASNWSLMYTYVYAGISFDDLRGKAATRIYISRTNFQVFNSYVSVVDVDTSNSPKITM